MILTVGFNNNKDSSQGSYKRKQHLIHLGGLGRDAKEGERSFLAPPLPALRLKRV